MLKRILAQEFNAVPAYFTINTNAVTGMAVTITDHENGVVSLASGGKDIYVLDKNPIAEGIDAARANLPDSFEGYNQFNAGDKVLAVKFRPGDVFAVSADAIVSESAFTGGNGLLPIGGRWDSAEPPTGFEATGRITMVGSTKMYQIRVTDE